MAEIKSLDSREHILLRPNMYIGAVDTQSFKEYINGQLTEVSYIPGLIKIINEIIDNSIDIAIKTDFKGCNEVSVKITDDYIEVTDNGPGIPVKKNDKGQYLPFVCWGSALSGSNFDNDAERKSIGMNGVGSYCTNVWSKKFTGISDDGLNRYEVTFKNNASTYNEVEKKSTGKGVTVKFYPDLERFKIDKIDEISQNIIYQRLINLNMCFPLIKFKFNGKKLTIKNFKGYVNNFSNYNIIYNDEKYSFAVIPSTTDEFQHFSYVNGLKIPEGGTHIDIISNNIVAKLREKLERKYKTIKPADIKNRLFVIAILKDFNNPKFNSQTKEKLTNSVGEVNAYLGDIDYEKISKSIMKVDEIINPIIDIFKIKEEFKRKQELKALDKPKKIKDEHYTPATKNKKYLLVCEGASAQGGLMPVCGREDFGYYTLKGKPLNSWASTQQKFTANKELSGLYQVIKNEGYTDLVYATDSDLDGIHIRALLCGFVRKYLSDLGINVGMLETPVIGYFKGDKLTRWIYNLNDKIETNEKSFYYKGLGSWDKEDLKKVVEVDGFSKMIVPLDFNDCDESLEEWLGNDSEPRKKYIINNEFSIVKV